MPIVFRCPCGKKLSAQDQHAGQQTQCPACGQMMIIPGQEAPAVPGQAPQPVAPVPGGDYGMAPAPTAPPASPWQAPGQADHQAQHTFSSFPTAVVVLLHFLTLGIFTTIWLGLLHGKMPLNRHDDPSAGKAIGFLFIPIYNFYWVFFTYHRLCVRLNEQLELGRHADEVPKGLAITMCILMLLPYVSLISFFVLFPVFAGIVQSKVNLLAADREQAMFAR